MLKYSYEALFAEGGICAMPPLRRRRLLDEILGLPCQDRTLVLEPGDVMVCLVASYLFQIGLFSDEQVWLILRNAKPVIACVGRELSARLAIKGEPSQAWLIAVADRRYISWSTSAGWLCLETGERLPELSRPPMETISFHLPQIALRMINQR